MYSKALWSISVSRDNNSPDMESGMHESIKKLTDSRRQTTDDARQVMAKARTM